MNIVGLVRRSALVLLLFAGLGSAACNKRIRKVDPDSAFITELADWCTEFTRQNSDISLKDLLARVYQRGAQSEYSTRFVNSTLILDARDKPVRHSPRKGGFEWRGAGSDGEFGTADDVIAVYLLAIKKKNTPNL